MNIEILVMLAVIAVLFILVIVLFVLYSKTNKKLNELNLRYEKFMMGKDGSSLETRFEQAVKDIDRIQKIQKQQKGEMIKLDKRVKKSYQKIGLIKYNGFAGMGGMSSFVLALLDETNSGFILNAIHSREGCYPYIKSVQEGKCETTLGREENNALEMALRNM